MRAAVRNIAAVLAVTAACAAASTVPTASAEAVRVVVDSRQDVAAGAHYGLAGPYEALTGRMHFEVDPAARVNRAVADIERAPTNASGRVEFSADFYLLKPKNADRGNGTLLFEVSNRGGKGMLPMLNRAAGSLSPVTAAEMGDGFLLRNGFSLFWIGWQFDVPQGDGRLRVDVPSANGVAGLVRSDFVVRQPADTHSLADRNMTAYPAADPEGGEYAMTVRDSALAERQVVPRNRWRFARRDGDRVVDDPTHVYLEGGFEPHRIYEVVYEAENPALAGLGLAAVRDAISLLKYDGAPELGFDAADLERAIGFGISQSGRFLRTFLYDGFNEDERQRIVFDGLMPHIAGGARGSFNHRFAQPSRASWSFFYPNALFPFADVEQREGDWTDGVLSRVDARFRPKIVYTNSSNEYWRGSAALTHVDTDGREDLPLPQNVRMYLFAGTQHVPTSFPPAAPDGQHANNPNDYNLFLRPLLAAMNAWITTGAAPPPSRYPLLRDGTLTTRDALHFPRIPGVRLPPRLEPVRRVDHGDAFRAARVVEHEPPRVGRPYPLLLPQVDADGNEIAGLVSPELAVPLATYTGWNLYRAPFGPEHELVSLQGAFVPLARSRAEREAAGDPRPSIEERYPSRAHFVGRIAEHATALAQQGYLLAEDLPWVVARAGEQWRFLVENATGASD
jgi:hypothetical protein